MHDDHETSDGVGRPPSNLWADRVNEAYYDGMGSDFGHQTRDRINWMCAQAKGKTVLDVGCSQGIASILLAREGMDVVGLDIYPPAIDYALVERSKEIESVASRLDFRCSELAALEGESFDTVIMGEVVEHQTNPGRFVRQGARMVAAGGRLVITVPFGLHPWPDHKSTIFPRQIYLAVTDDFRLTQLDVSNGYIRMVMDRRNGVHEEDSEISSLFTSTEEGAVEYQSRYYEVKTRTEALTKVVEESKSGLERAQRERDELTKQQQALEKDLALKSQLVESLQHTLAESSALKLAIEARGLALRESESTRNTVELQLHSLQARRDRESSEQTLADLSTLKLAIEAGELALKESESARNTVELQLHSLQGEYDAFRLQARRDRESLEAEKRIAEEQVKNLSNEILGQKAVSARALGKLEETIEGLRRKLRSLEDEYSVAQYKRTGHYLHLQAERERSKKLIPLLQDLYRENQLYRRSIALEVGRAFLESKSLRGMVRFPHSLIRAWKRYRRRDGGEVMIEPLVIPRLEVVVLPPLKTTTQGLAPSIHTEKSALESGLTADETRKKLSALGWVQEVRPSSMPVMSVLDEFSHACFAPHASLIEPRPDNWEALLEAYEPRFLLVESSWKGNYGTWQYRVANYANPPGKELSEMVEGFRMRGIPTVFWNKEDPVHFNNFVEAASQFDIVLTTASEAVSKYREKTSARIGVLQFAAEDSLHNPIGSARRNHKVCFAGSFYANRFHERRDDQLMLLDAARDFDFDIYDRNYDPKAAASSDFAFPERFSQFVRGSMSYEAMGRAYREYRVFLNVNSVIDSPTMFSRRVFELLACGTPVVSTWSRGTEETFGDDLVWHVRSKEEASEAIRVLMTDDREWRRRSLAGIRAVFSQHTFRHRFRQITDMIGLVSAQVDPFGEVLVVAEAANQVEASTILGSFSRQSMAVGVKKRLLLVTGGGFDVQRPDDTIDVVAVDSGGLFGALSRSTRPGSNGMLALLSPLGVYGQHYLQDLLHAARYSGAAVVGKAATGSDLDQHAFDIALDPRTLLVNRALLDASGVDIRSLLRGDMSTVLKEPRRVYATDSANYRRMDAVPVQAQVGRVLKQIEL